MGNYDDQHRFQRQHSPDRTNDYTSQPPRPTTTSLSSSSSHLYQQNYGLSRSITLPESQNNSRHSNSYNTSIRQMHNDNDLQHDGIKTNFVFVIVYSFVIYIDRHRGSRRRQPSVETAR